MQASSLSRTPSPDSKPAGASPAIPATVDIGQDSRNDKPSQPAADTGTDIHAEGGCCGGCGG